MQTNTCNKRVATSMFGKCYIDVWLMHCGHAKDFLCLTTKKSKKTSVLVGGWLIISCSRKGLGLGKIGILRGERPDQHHQ